MATLAVVPTAPAETRLTLYDIEEHLQCLAETAECVPADRQEQFVAEFHRTLLTAVDKRDQVGRFMAHLESQIAFAKTEIARLQERKRKYEQTLEQVEGMVLRVVLSREPDAKGRYPKLEGRTVSFGAKKCPASTAIDDEALVPAGFKTVEIKMPMAVWEEAMDGLDLELRAKVLDAIRKTEATCDVTAIKAALKDGTGVPGARLVTDKKVLVRS